MKKKILLLAAMASLLVIAFAISVSATPRSYSSFEVVLDDGARQTVYSANLEDVWQGRFRLSETMYTEAPVDTEGTYATLDWSKVVEIDFTNTTLSQYSNGNYTHRTGGTNSEANGNVFPIKDWSNASTFATVKKVTTGNCYKLGASLFKGWTGLETIIIDAPVKELPDDFLMNSSVKNIIFDENSRVTRCYNNLFRNCDNLVSIELPDSFTYLGNSGLFYDCDNLESVKWPANCPKIPGSAFSGCEKLKFEIPSFIDEIKSSAFTGCTSITSVVIPATVASIGSDCFRNCINLTSIVFEEGCSITRLYAHTFDSCNLSEITLPNTVTQLRQNVFAGNKNLKVINLGASFVDCNLEGNASASINCGLGLEKLYLAKTFTAASVRGSIFGSDTNSGEYGKIHPTLVIFYEGDKAAAEAIVLAGKGQDKVVNGVFAFMTVVSLEEYEALKAADALSGRYIVYGYNKCDAFYGGVHAEGTVINSCQYGCGRNCGVATLLENPQHELSLVITFGDKGYFSASCATESCSVCNTVTMSEDIGAMFVDYGYSATEGAINGKYSVSQFYGINKTAIEQYRKINAEFEFGFVVAANANPFEAVENGTLASDKIFVTEERFFALDYVSISVGGIAGENMSKAITFCMFVKDGDDTFYLDGGETVEAVTMKSYNDIFAMTN